MKRSPMKPGTKPLRTHKPMARSSAMVRTTGVKARLRTRKPVAAKPKRAARDNEDRNLLTLCRGQPCYLALPGICNHDPATVVPAHSNQYRHGKAKGLKAHHRFTVPGCHACHAEIDQGMRFSKEDKFALWDAAFARWEPMREMLLREANR